MAEAEADITRAKLSVLNTRPLPGDYDLAHLQKFHAFLFGDVYPWAGDLRTVDIAKETPFCPVHNLRTYADEVFGQLRSAGWLRGLPRGEFVHGLAELYGDINAFHPFREGNGRTQRAFLSQLSAHAGWSLSWVGMSQDENREASIKSFMGDNDTLERMIDRLVVRPFDVI